MRLIGYHSYHTERCPCQGINNFATVKILKHRQLGPVKEQTTPSERAQKRQPNERRGRDHGQEGIEIKEWAT